MRNSENKSEKNHKMEGINLNVKNYLKCKWPQ